MTRSRDMLEGQVLPVSGRWRHGRLELLVVLPDGTSRLIPQAWTDNGDGTCAAGVTLGSVSDLLASCALVAALRVRAWIPRARRSRSPSRPRPDGRYRRRSVPLLGMLAGFGLELAGRAAARLAGALGMPVRSSTVLRLVMALPDPRERLAAGHRGG